jgi:hypothetical protein
MSCVDVLQKRRTEDDQVKCNKKFLDKTDSSEVGGYAFADSGSIEDNVVVLCDLFFRPGQEQLEPLITELRKTEALQKDPNRMMGKAKLLLHKLTHLAAISETDDSKRPQLSPTVVHITHSKPVAVSDQILRYEANRPDSVYGPLLVQRMGMHRLFSVRNRITYNGMWSCCLEHTGLPVLTLVRSGIPRNIRFMEVLQGLVRNV